MENVITYVKNLIENDGLEMPEAVRVTAAHFQIHEDTVWAEIVAALLR